MDHTELLGLTVRDTVTGFEGVVTGYIYYLTGCNQASVVPRVGSDNSAKDSGWYDVQRLQVLSGHPRVELNNTKTPGFGEAPPARR